MASKRSYRPDYTGARGRIQLADIATLSPRRWAVQPKLDGCYAVVRTGKEGQVTSVSSRTGIAIPPKLHRLRGQIVGPPQSLLVGELAAWSQAGRATSDAAGYVICELFDLLRIGRESLLELPYRERRDRLWRAHADLDHRGIPRRGWVRDKKRRRHDRESGQYVDEGTEQPLHWGRCPIIEQVPPARAADLWQRVGLVPWVEGLVVVALDAPIGRRGSKKKCKPLYTEDCSVMSADRHRARVTWRYGRCDNTIVPSAGHHNLQPGEVVEVGHEGWYDSGQPRFPRLLRRRQEYQGPSALEFTDLSGE